MKESKGLLKNISISDVVRNHREQSGMSLSKVAALAGISKSVLSRIENNEINRPEIKTIKAISKVLPIPYVEMLEYYAEVENRTDVLKQLLSELAEISSMELTKKVAHRLIYAPYQETDETLAYLYNLAGTDIPASFKLTVLQVITDYAKTYSNNEWLVKSLLQKYLIERNDFSRLKETYLSGKEILFFIQYLPWQEKPLAYWKLGLHAYNLKRYEECIELCKNAINLAPENPDLVRSALLAIIPSSFEIEEYETTEYYLKMLEQLETVPDTGVIEITRAMIQTRKGNYEESVLVLDKYFHIFLRNKEPRSLNIANDLLIAYLNQKKFHEMESIFDREEEILSLEYKTPYSIAEIGRFYKIKGLFHMEKNEFEKGITCFIKSIHFYQKISNFEEINECMKLIYRFHYDSQRVIDLPLLETLNQVYNIDVDHI